MLIFLATIKTVDNYRCHFANKDTNNFLVARTAIVTLSQGDVQQIIVDYRLW